MPQTALDLLRLLAEDASADALEERAATIQEVDPETGAAARSLALRVRTVLDARRRREAQLSALVDTARELASMRDTRGVLDAIVRRARALLSTDVAYLTVHDREVGDTYMRATDGSVSAHFQTLRLPLGAGLGGLVAQTARPHWTAEYALDERYRHTTDIDTAVEEEGLVAICGVPLLVDGDFVGVLFAANRGPRPFTPEEVSLLGSLAALAAVSLAQADAAADTRDALEALSAAHETVRRQAESAERAAAAHDRFTEIVLGGGGVDDIAGALAVLLGGWVVVIDAEGRRTATQGTQAPLAPTSGPDPLSQAPAVRTSESSGRLASADGVWAAAVTAADERMGTLVLGGRGPLDAGDQRTLERAAVVTALLLLFRRQSAETEHQMRTDLLADLLTQPEGRPQDEATLAARARAVGIDLTAPHVVAVCHPATGRPRRSVVLAAGAVVAGGSLLGSGPGTSTPGSVGGGLVAEHAGDIVVLVRGEDASGVASQLASRLSHQGPVTVGAAGPVTPREGLRRAYEEARRTADALVALGTPGTGSTAADLGFAGLVVGGAPDVGRYVADVLGPVLDYDARRRSDLVGTLEAYYAAGASPSRAASTLHVHVNTVTQRLERVTGLLGADWTEPSRSLEVQLALRLHRLSQRAA
ncbi:helix-turn-helix domain-containing protein [Cellulomonas fimi]|uniref:GAF domain-containing protein n=1 Tax=Cellulomonas fimi TaxID=1708 RepID=A0A7Y0LXC4_CELFI|nr:helix-turn-helix domain-containing protein [Cellulomonas fimi]NMR19093.1 GAF domain-containing protein [Cellulomonas fimi]